MTCVSTQNIHWVIETAIPSQWLL